MNEIASLQVEESSSEGALDFSLFQTRKAFKDLEGWVMSEEALSQPEDQVEAEIERRGRDVWRQMLQAHLWQRGTGNVGAEIVVSDHDGEVRQKKSSRLNDRKVASIFGVVTARRSAYSLPGLESVHPLDESAQLPGRSFSYEMQRRVIDDVVRGPYDEAVESLEKTSGQKLSKRSMEQIADDFSTDFDAFYEQRATPPTAGTGPIVVGTVDGKGVAMVKDELAEHKARRKKGEKPNKKKMATVAAVYTQNARIRTPEDVVESLFDGERPRGSTDARPESKRVWASLKKSKEDVIKQVAMEMATRDPDGTKLHIAVTDGERALQKRALRVIPGILLILDLLHVLEYLWKAAHAFYKENSDEAEAWVRKHALMILKGNVSGVIQGMRQSATKHGLKGSKREAVEKAAKYFFRNREYMKYDIYLATGLPIASGAVEGACKNLVKDRMERSGMRWTVPGAEAVLKLRAIKLSGDMSTYSRFHIQREQERLYGWREWRTVA